ncbi:hypothetical protein C5E45_21750 [Nocardia nova]|uniref:Uncharacterized protein n=1 Tax=Nocardia nova TaxID=37330 RepID=A0A2S6ALE3_9NOCA|nr:hypothetical protein C5E41_16385 [Nocardia nova]PPJ36044.1 hypothetical protein C5E45_21750 [Nocardia nova]
MRARNSSARLAPVRPIAASASIFLKRSCTGCPSHAIVAVVLRSVVGTAGTDAVRAWWPGTDDGYSAHGRLTGLPER